MEFLKPLTADEEQEILEIFFNGDEFQKKEAKDKLVEHNLRLVAHFAKRYQDSFLDNSLYSYEELISVGVIGLIKGVNTFSPTKKTKVSTYAGRCIENELRMFLRAKKKYNFDLSLDETLSTDFDGNEVSLIDKLIDENAGVEDAIIKNNDIVKLINILPKVLDENELYVVTKRYGINCVETTQKNIAKDLDISRSYVSRIEKKALVKLKKALS
ncbi:MAG: sigma-70 family RNA polymerase sigma factor [Lachnospirales bacterium]